MTGRISAAEDEAIRTAYSVAWPVPKPAARAHPRTADPAPTRPARAAPRPRLCRRTGSRTGTWVPTTNITSPNPTSARNEKVLSEVSRKPRPVLPSRIPTMSSPTTTGTCQRCGSAKSGPTRPAITMTASTAKSTQNLLSGEPSGPAAGRYTSVATSVGAATALSRAGDLRVGGRGRRRPSLRWGCPLRCGGIAPEPRPGHHVTRRAARP